MWTEPLDVGSMLKVVVTYRSTEEVTNNETPGLSRSQMENKENFQFTYKVAKMMAEFLSKELEVIDVPNGKEFKFEFTYSDPPIDNTPNQNECGGGSPAFTSILIGSRKSRVTTLPNAISEDIMIENVTPRTEKDEREETKQCGHSRVLIVEDNKAVRETIAQHMELFCKANFDEAESGQKAIKMYKESMQWPCCWPYELILMDIELPDINGIKVTEKILRIKQGLRTKIVALTGSEVDTEERKAFDGFINKPYEAKRLKRLLEELDLLRDDR